MHQLAPADLELRPFQVLDRDWALLVAGHERPNPMTVSWGGFGTLWNRPVVTVYVRPTRFTYGLLDEHPEFTLNWLPPDMRKALDLCGSRSGRDTDKWSAAGLTPTPSEVVAVPRIAGATMVLEARVLASFDLDPDRFFDPAIDSLYPKRDYHRAYVGGVVAAWRA